MCWYIFVNLAFSLYDCPTRLFHWAVMKGCSRSQMQSNVADGTYIDYKVRKDGERYEVILPEVVKNFVHQQVSWNISALFLHSGREQINNETKAIALFHSFSSLCFLWFQTKHCLLDVNAEGEVIDRIVALQLFPIVVFLKYKSPSKIK